jgi:hypothetical protein
MLMKLYEIDQIIISAYNSEANDMMKCEHKSLINAFLRWLQKSSANDQIFDIDIMSKLNNYQKKYWLNTLWDSLWICLYSDN